MLVPIIVGGDVIITALKAVGQSLKGICRRIMDDISILENFLASRVEG